MTYHYPDLGKASDWSYREENSLQPITSNAHVWEVYAISMEFLRSFLRRHFAGKTVVASRNVDSFLRLSNIINAVLITFIVTTTGNYVLCSIELALVT